MRDLAARGYTRSAITESYGHLLGETTALVSVSRIRYATAGRELERLGETYTLRKTGDDWKIVAAVVHDANRVLKDRSRRPAGATSG